MSNHKTKRRDGPSSDYVPPLTAEEKARPVVVHPLPAANPDADKRLALRMATNAHNSGAEDAVYYARVMQLRGDELIEACKFEDWCNFVNAYDDECGMMSDDEWRQVRAHLWTVAAIDEACSLISESPMVMFGIALNMELDMMAAIWQFEAWYEPEPGITPAPAQAHAPVILPQHLQDVNEVLEQNARKTPVTVEYRALVETTLEAYVGQANGQPIRITADNFIRREKTEVRMFCRFLANDDRDGFLVGVALNGDDPARPVYKGPELLAYLELCHKAGEEFRKRMVGKPSVPPFKCQSLTMPSPALAG